MSVEQKVRDSLRTDEAARGLTPDEREVIRQYEEERTLRARERASKALRESFPPPEPEEGEEEEYEPTQLERVQALAESKGLSLSRPMTGANTWRLMLGSEDVSITSYRRGTSLDAIEEFLLENEPPDEQEQMRHRWSRALVRD